MTIRHSPRGGSLRRLLLWALASCCLLGAAWPAHAAAAPNILFIVTDDQRLDGTMAVMPKTRQWFEAGGTWFPKAVASTPLCCPSRGTIFSGQYAHNHNVRSNTQATNLVQDSTIQRYLQLAGYQTGIFGKFLNLWDLAVDPPYWDRFSIFNAGYNSNTAAEPGTISVNEQGVLRELPEYSTTYFGQQARDFVQQAEADDQRPWFLYVAPFAPHSPSVPEPQYENAPVPLFEPHPNYFEQDLSDKPPWVADLQTTPEIAQAERTAQLRTLMTADDEVESLMQTLQQTGELNDTFAFFVSDNGYQWGDHGQTSKARPYTDSMAIPFYMRWPGHVATDNVDGRLVGNVDMVPTALEAAGVSSSGLPIDGQSLLNPNVARTRMLSEFWRINLNVPTWAALRGQAYQYTEHYDNDGALDFREYYDLVNDPWQLTNLLNDGDPQNDPPVAELSAQLARDRVCSGQSCSPFDTYPRPIGAAKLRFTLVPAFESCSAPGGSHGAPLDLASCDPPRLSSAELTFPNDDSSVANGSVTIRYRCTDGGIPPACGSSGDQADLVLTARLNDVHCAPAHSTSTSCGAPNTTAGEDYTGNLLFSPTLKITDRYDAVAFNRPATTLDFGFPVGMPCAASPADMGVGSGCNVITSADAIVPDAVREDSRALVEVGQIQVLDAGADGLLDAGTITGGPGSCPPACLPTGDEDPLARQGVFVP